MKLYLLQPIRGWKYGCDVALGFVIRAESEIRAREMAAELHGDEGPVGWLSPELSACTVLKPDGAEKIILRDFKAC